MATGASHYANSTNLMDKLTTSANRSDSLRCLAFVLDLSSQRQSLALQNANLHIAINFSL